MDHLDAVKNFDIMALMQLNGLMVAKPAPNSSWLIPSCLHTSLTNSETFLSYRHNYSKKIYKNNSALSRATKKPVRIFRLSGLYSLNRLNENL